MVGKARSALIYPAFVFGGLILSAVVMLVFVVPQITTVLEESGQELPMLTVLLIQSSEFVRQFWYFLLIIFLGLIGGIWYYYSKTAPGQIGWDKLKLRLPVFGTIFQKIYLGRFSESLSTLLVGGIPITQALDTTSDIVGNHVYKTILREVVEVVKKGQLMNVVLRRYPKVIPPLVTQMVAVGESTGQLDVVLSNVGTFYQKEVSRTMDNLVSLIEPILILVLGVGVATLIIAILVPMYNLASSF
jgi:type IV pilus assembly protein PilC